MQKMPNQDIVGQRLAAMICSPFRRRYVPLDGATLYTLFPDAVRHRGQTTVVMRLGAIRMRLGEDGKLVGKCSQWWDVDVLHKKWLGDQTSVPAEAVSARNALITALERHYVSPFGDDLPIYVDVAASRNRAYDWNILEWDVFRGLNSQIPFKYKATRKVKNKIVSELPFLDMESHFRSVVSDDMCCDLIRQLIAQHIKNIGSMSLMPLRWIATIDPKDTVVAETGAPLVVNVADARRSKIEVGAINIVMTREPRRRQRRAKPNHVR